MPDYERPAEENERRLETASCRDPPPNNYGAQLLERTLPPQQQKSGGRKKAGGIAYRDNYKGWIVEIRIPKWTNANRLWINSGDLHAAQYNADAAYYFTGQRPFHFPNARLDYLPLRLSTGEELTTREKCSAHVAKIAKDPALLDQRRDFKKLVQKLIREMVRTPKVVRFLIIVRASPRQAWQPRLQANPEDTDSPFTEGENGTAMEAGTPSEASASTVLVNASQFGNLVPVAEETHSAPLEVDSLSEEAIQAIAPTVTVNPASVFQFDSTTTSGFDMVVDMSTAFIASFGMNPCEPQNSLTSVGQRLGIGHPRFGEKEKEDLNRKERLTLPDRYEEEIWKSIEPLNVEL